MKKENMRLLNDESIAKITHDASVQTLHHDYKNDICTQYPSSYNDVSIQTNIQLKPKIHRNNRSVKSFLQRASTTMMNELQMSFIVSDAFRNQQLFDTDDDIQYCNNNYSSKYDDNKSDGNTNDWKLNGMCLSLDGTIIVTIYGSDDANSANNGMIRMESILSTNNRNYPIHTSTSTSTDISMEYDCSLTCIASLPTKATISRNHYLFVIGCENGELLWIQYDPNRNNDTTNSMDILYSTPFGRHHVDSITSLQCISINSKDNNDNEYYLISTSIDGLLLVWSSSNSNKKKSDSYYPIYGYRINHCISTVKIIQNYTMNSILLIIASCNGSIYQGTLSSSSLSSSSYPYTLSRKKKKDRHCSIPTKFKWTTNAKHYIGAVFQETEEQELFIHQVEEYAQRSSSFCHSDTKNIIINTKVIFDSNAIQYPNISSSLQEFPSPHIGTITSLSLSTSINDYSSSKPTSKTITKSFDNHHLNQNGIMMCSYGMDGFIKVYRMIQHPSNYRSHNKPQSIHLVFSLDTMIQYNDIDIHDPIMSLSSSSYGIILPKILPLVRNVCTTIILMYESFLTSSRNSFHFFM